MYHASFSCHDGPNFRSLSQNSSSLSGFFDLGVSLKRSRPRNSRSTGSSSVDQMPPLGFLLISASPKIVRIDYLRARPTRYPYITKATNLYPLVRSIYASGIPPVFVKKPPVGTIKKIFRWAFSFSSLKIRWQHLFYDRLILFTPIIRQQAVEYGIWEAATMAIEEKLIRQRQGMLV